MKPLPNVHHMFEKYIRYLYEAIMMNNFECNVRTWKKNRANIFFEILAEQFFSDANSAIVTDSDGMTHTYLSVRPRISYQATNNSASEDEYESTVFLTN